MFSGFLRKARQVRDDPVLRRWLLERMFGRTGYAGSVTGARPDYLTQPLIADGDDQPVRPDVMLAQCPAGALDIALAGSHITLHSDQLNQFVDRRFAETEILLAMHRFSWLPLCISDSKYNWAAAVYREWERRFWQDTGWAWHPYTVAERLLNLFVPAATRQGMVEFSEPSRVRKHLRAIYDHLEYFGPGHTGNHLANNGRGLFIAGLVFEFPDCADAGEKILLEHAANIFSSSGCLREGSSHYHLLVTRWYLECWLYAGKYGHPAAAKLREICLKAAGRFSEFDMPGGFPLLGDVSPDCPPDYLQCLIDVGRSGWLDSLEDDFRQRVRTLLAESHTMHPENQSLEHWHFKNLGPWSCVWSLPVDGWAPLPGHGHSDFGSFELHLGNQRIFADPGRRSYDPSGEQDKGAVAHNTLQIDGHDPYPANRPYYDDAFRVRTAAGHPEYLETVGEFNVTTSSFSRLRGVGRWSRQWRLVGADLIITDKVEGQGRRTVSRYFQTIQPTSLVKGGVSIGPCHMGVDGELSILSANYWPAYNTPQPATRLVVQNQVTLPWQSSITIKAGGV